MCSPTPATHMLRLSSYMLVPSVGGKCTSIVPVISPIASALIMKLVRFINPYLYFGVKEFRALCLLFILKHGQVLVESIVSLSHREASGLFGFPPSFFDSTFYKVFGKECLLVKIQTLTSYPITKFLTLTAF